jgi:hypothetical protein
MIASWLPYALGACLFFLLLICLALISDNLNLRFQLGEALAKLAGRYAPEAAERETAADAERRRRFCRDQERQ